MDIIHPNSKIIQAACFLVNGKFALIGFMAVGHVINAFGIGFFALSQNYTIDEGQEILKSRDFAEFYHEILTYFISV